MKIYRNEHDCMTCICVRCKEIFACRPCKICTTGVRVLEEESECEEFSQAGLWEDGKSPLDCDFV